MEKKVKSEIIYDGKIIKVYKDQVECPNKRLATREIVRHHGGVGVLAVVDDCILLVKQFRYAYNKDTLEIPAGKKVIVTVAQMSNLPVKENWKKKLVIVVNPWNLLMKYIQQQDIVMKLFIYMKQKVYLKLKIPLKEMKMNL